MPIHTMHHQNGVFFAKQVGYVDHVDARMWANALNTYAQASDFPIVAVIDMTEVDRLCPTTVKTFAQALESRNVLNIALIAGDLMASRNAKVLGKLADVDRLRIFSSRDAAQRFANERLQPSFGAYTAQSVMVMAIAV